MLTAKEKLSLGRKLFFKWRNKVLSSGVECPNIRKHCQSQGPMLILLFINYFSNRVVMQQ